MLEACMKNCGRRFQKEAGRNRFLDVLFKIVCPRVSSFWMCLCKIMVTFCSIMLSLFNHLFFQYMGRTIPPKVETKILDMLYNWTIAFPNETKISRTYEMLIKWGMFACGQNSSLFFSYLPSLKQRLVLILTLLTRQLTSGQDSSAAT